MITSDLTVARKLAAPSATALAVIALVGCGRSTRTVTTTAPQNTTEQPTQAICTKPCADADGWIAEVANVKYDVKSDNEFIKPESGNVFVTMDVKFINKSNRKHSASSFDFKLKSAGVERNIEFIGPCEHWSSVDVEAGASYGPKCLSFQAAAGQPTGLVLIWRPGLIKAYEIPVEGAATSGAPAEDPAAVITQHFKDLDSGDYQAAFKLLTASYQAKNPSWVSERQAAAPRVKVISVGTPQTGSGGAQVPVDFYARDRNATRNSDTKCRQFKGTVHMVKESGEWRYDPSASSLNATVVDSTNPNCPS